MDREDEDATCGRTGGSSTQISGCHEAVETRTIRFKNMFSNGTSPQPPPWPFNFSLWYNRVRPERYAST